PYVLADAGSTFGHAANGSLLLAIPVAMLAGLVSFLSPCVLPLVPGYLSYITGLSGADLVAQAENDGDARRRWHVSGRVLAGPTLPAARGPAAPANAASAGPGALLTFVYCLGLGLPFIATGLAFRHALGAFAVVKRHYGVVVWFGGALLVAVGVLLLTGQWEA